jgi:hypothetical protein
MRPSPRRLALVWIVLATGIPARPAAAADLPALLLAVEANAAFDVPAMAEVQLTTPGAPAPVAVRLYGRGRVVRLETTSGWRALVKASKVVAAAPGKAPRAKTEEPLPGSPLLVADFAPFVAGALRVPQISDDGPLGVVVTGEPRPPSPYVLMVYTIQRDHPVVSAAKYYRWEINNLVQMTRVRQWAQLGDRRRPQLVDVQDLAGGKTTTLTFAWQARPELPAALFVPSGLAIPVPPVSGSAPSAAP